LTLEAAAHWASLEALILQAAATARAWRRWKRLPSRRAPPSRRLSSRARAASAAAVIPVP